MQYKFQFCILYVWSDVEKKKKRSSLTGNRTPASRVTGGDTHHYTIRDLLNTSEMLYVIFLCCSLANTVKLMPKIAAAKEGSGSMLMRMLTA